MKKQESLPGRRDFLQAAAAGVPLSLLSAEEMARAEENVADASRPLRIVCVGAHPDDPESGCGGTLARYASAGHAVTVIYLTRGEAGIPGKSHEEAAAIRSAEAEAACKVLGGKPIFAGQIDGATEVTHKAAEALGNLLGEEKPDVVFTHWPIDTHFDHQA